MACLLTLPARPLLLPGVRVTRRDDGHLQIGLDPTLAVVTPDVPEARELLRCLGEGSIPAIGPRTVRLAGDLLERGLIIDGDACYADLAPIPSKAQAVAAAYAHADLGAPALLAHRRTRSVRVAATTLLASYGGLAGRLLGLSGIPAAGRAPDPVSAVLLMGTGESDRARVDALTRSDVPHLLLQVSEGIVRLGPFVVPGVTACLRCVDARLGDSDPRRALVVEQYAGVAAPRADGVPEPIDPAVVTAAVGWAVRDMVSFLDDEVPTTWSATVRFGPGMHQQRSEWDRHPRCGCAWADEAAVG